ncbi:SDR family NAD(P)-dependent oxidoreductase [Candidatus Palauibacter sp.]|uniref:SDR family NAD(P)-dependent oxidoreductase n=1 Tax=Candidatus Palauibacter sp. TaxID=3101350 RepID=UPI003D097470
MTSTSRESPVAIVGYSYRMPGGIRTDSDFWRLLREREIVQEPITDRYGRGYRPIGRFSGPGRFASPYEGLIREDVEKLIDPKLFGLSQDEVLAMDPQVRMLLNCSWETCERVGWGLHSLHNSATGVFIGAQIPPVASWRPMHGAGPFDVTSLSVAMLANRVSYHFNLMGPSITYCTACSASLTALHSAMAALQSGDCEQALVGSVNYLGTSRLSASFNALGVISPDGKCHSFDADANGYIRSEGAFIFALKPLDAAERDGDQIHAVIEGTAVNAAGAADGSSGLAQGRYISAPTRHAQVDLMRKACARAGRAPGEFDYIEAHATGTVVGDRIEGNAITEAFGGVDRDVPLRVSSVKSNLGHMEAAAFHCALLKVVLMMQRRTFAPTSKNFAVPNPEIDFDGGRMQVQTECEPFPERPVVVGINSFGFGGANGHCVIREYEPPRSRAWSSHPASRGGFMIPLSARNAGALTRGARRLREQLAENGTDLYTVAGNLSRRRTHFATRTAFAVRNREELLASLDEFAESPSNVSTTDDDERRIAMVFAGQGTQWAGCGQGLYDADPVFRRAIDAVEDHWRTHSDISLRDACFNAPREELDEVRLAQPAIFMIQCALFELFKTWGVHPECVVGHSSGEVAAAYASGALSLAEATRLVYHRATLQQSRAGSGRMLAIGLDLAGVEEVLDSLDIAFRPGGDRPTQVEIACENAPASVVACGREAELRPVMAELDRRNVQNQLLAGNIAFHSSAMDPIRDDAREALAFLDDCAFDAGIPFVSSVTGDRTERLDGGYWWTNIRESVHFARAIDTIMREFRPDVFLEIAPHSALQSAVAQCIEQISPTPANIPSLHRDSDDRLGFQEALASLFRSGVALDFEAQYPRPRPIAHLLPGHPRDEQALIDHLTDDEFFVRQGQYSHGPLVGHRVPSEHLLFEARLSEKDFPWLTDHRVHHAAIMPAAGYIELVLQALEGAPVHFEVLEFLQPCPIPKTPVRLQTALHPVPGSPDEFTFTISSRPYDVDAASEVHCRGRVARIEAGHPVGVPARLEEIDRSSCETVFARSEFYERLEAVLSEAFQYGPYFQTIRLFELIPETRALIVDIEMDEELWATGRDEGYVGCPPLLDGGLQIFLSYLLNASHLFAIPQRAERTTFLRPPTGPRITCHVTRPADDWMDANERGQYSVQRGERAAGAISFYDSDTGHLIAHIALYTYFTSNPRWNDLPKTKHEIVWQPKFVPGGRALQDRLPEGEIEPAALIAALERAAGDADGDEGYGCHVAEFSGSRAPDRTILAGCLDHLTRAGARSEFWLLSDSEETAQGQYDAFNQQDAALRFQCLDPASEPAMDEGLLRPRSVEVAFLHRSDDLPGPDGWRFLQRLCVAGGLALVRHDDGDSVEDGDGIEPGEGWTVVRAGRRTTLLQAPHVDAGETGDGPLPGPRWVLGEPSSRASEWTARLDAPEAVQSIPHEAVLRGQFDSLEVWSQAAEVRAIDFFCGADPHDPTGEMATEHFVGFVQALVSARLANANHVCRLSVVTHRGVFDVEHPRGSALWGAVRSMAMEVGDEAKLDFRLVDLGDADDLETLARLARCDLRERELAVRENRLWAPRISSIRKRYSHVSAGDDAEYRLTLDNPGQIAGLQMKTYELPPVGPSDVKIEVEAAALNFRDVMVTLGLLPALAYERSALGRQVGMEGSGTVRQVGSKVRHCAVGDQVAFIAGGCIANHAVVPETLVFAKPDRLSMEEAASTLSVYVTAFYSLIHLARLRKGQRVLIHSAMGGVGQAAIALARHAGAEIFTTAGSADKREQLLAMGVRGAFDSHSYDWYDDLMTATSGEGVDVVLNSLAGRHIELCLRALRPGGWHCEIGKIDIYADNDLGLRIFRKNLRFAAIDVDRLMLDDPGLTREISETCMDLLGRGALPPLPITVFPYRDYARALRLMTTGRHQGKLVLKAPRESADPRFPVADIQPLFDPDATYLVTGGLGGFGLRLIPYLVASGARHLTLLDRDPQRRRDAEWIRRSSALVYMDIEAEIDIVSGDVAVEADVQRCVRQLERPLKGVFHLAGALDDRLLDDMSAESLRRVFAPKASGALHLHEATAGHELDHFVLFSSTASMLGNPGQINYSGANGFLDGLAAARHRQGLPCLAYNMPAVADAGMAARSLPVLRMMRAAGMPPVSSDLAIANLDYALRALSDRPHLVTSLFERPSWTVDFPDYMRIGRVMHNHDAFEAGSGGELTLENVVEQIAAKVAELCGHEDGEVDEPLSSFGLTSISVAELGTFIQAEFNYRVSALELMTTASSLSLAQGIIHGQEDIGEDEAGTAGDGPAGTAEISLPRARRTPSAFANAPEDHFPTDHSDRVPAEAT